jgi:hypothetical protein
MNAYSGHWQTSSASPTITGELSTQPGFAPTRGRRTDRVTVDLGGGLRQRGASGVSVQIMDLSTDGFRVATHLELAPGTEVWLRLPGLEPSAARVIWSEGPHIGCAFSRPLHPAVLQMILSKTDQRQSGSRA